MKNDRYLAIPIVHMNTEITAWYHFVLEHDAANTYFKIHVNGTSSNHNHQPTQTVLLISNNVQGWNGGTSNDSLHDFYLANVEFVDGLHLLRLTLENMIVIMCGNQRFTVDHMEQMAINLRSPIQVVILLLEMIRREAIIGHLRK